MSAAHKLAHTTGVVWVHSAPRSLCPHVVWALESVFDTDVHLTWAPQPMGHALMRAELSWSGPIGTGSATASALRGLENVRFEVTEDPTHASMGSRWAYAPGLGIHHAWISHHGDIVLNESRVEAAMGMATFDEAKRHMAVAIGVPWDDELEPYRLAGEGHATPYHRVG